MTRTNLFPLLPVSLFFLLTACKKEFDVPPLQSVKEGVQVFISNLKSRVATVGKTYRFGTGDSSLFCTVIADETSGNIFKQLFVKDDAGEAIQLNLINPGGLFAGDRLRINMNGLYIINANNMIYIDSVDLIKNAVKLSSGNTIHPLEMSLQTLLLQSPTGKPSQKQSQLIQLLAVEFLANINYPTFADAISKSSIDQTIRDCQNNQLLIRTSGYANFAAKPLPVGNGYLTGILTQYNDRLQFTICNYNDINMNGPLCSITNPTINPSILYLKKDFNDNNLTSGGWVSSAVTNSLINWGISSFSTTPTPFAKISGFIGGSNTQAETWYISPAMDLSKAKDPYLSFLTAAKYPGNLLEVLISNDYVTGNPSASNWTSLAGSYTLSPAPQTGGFVWTPSGKVNLNAYKTAASRIAFKYISTPSGSTTYELDDIVVQED